MKRVLFLFVTFSVLALASASAQNIAAVRSAIASTNKQGGFVHVAEDEGVKSAIATVESKTSTPAKADGYRFVIFYDNEQFADERAMRALSTFRSRFKDISSYLSSESPSFRIVVGDCFTYEDIAVVRHRIGGSYPNAALSDAKIPYRVLCRIKGENRMKIERSGVEIGGVEVDYVAEELEYQVGDADSLPTSEPATEPVAEVAVAAETEEVKSSVPATELIASEDKSEEGAVKTDNEE